MCVFCSCQCLNIVIFFVKGLGKYGVLFYNSLIIIIPTLLASAFTGDFHKVRYHQFKSVCVHVYSPPVWPRCLLWHHRQSRLKAGLKPGLYFASSCPASWGRIPTSHTALARWLWHCFSHTCCVPFPPRFVLMYSIVLCSYYNSALTTTVVGAIKVGILLMVVQTVKFWKILQTRKSPSFVPFYFF